MPGFTSQWGGVTFWIFLVLSWFCRIYRIYRIKSKLRKKLEWTSKLYSHWMNVKAIWKTKLVYWLYWIRLWSGISTFERGVRKKNTDIKEEKKTGDSSLMVFIFAANNTFDEPIPWWCRFYIHFLLVWTGLRKIGVSQVPWLRNDFAYMM